MTIGELIKILSEHHPDKEVLCFLSGESEPYEVAEVADEHDSVWLVVQ